MSTAISLDTTLAPPLPIHKFTIAQYHQLGEIGLLQPEDRVELLEGWIVKKMNQRPARGFAVRLLNAWLQRDLPDGWLCQCQLPISTERSEPEPDVAIVRGVHSDYRDRHPNGSDCRLLIEVADSSVQKDRAKATIYLNAGVEEYWIVNLVDRQVECYVNADNPNASRTSMLLPTETIRTQIGNQTLSFALCELFN